MYHRAFLNHILNFLSYLLVVNLWKCKYVRYFVRRNLLSKVFYVYIQSSHLQIIRIVILHFLMTLFFFFFTLTLARTSTTVVNEVRMGAALSHSPNQVKAPKFIIKHSISCGFV